MNRKRTHFPDLTDADREMLAQPMEPRTLREIALANIERKRAGQPMQFPPNWRQAVEVKDLKPEGWPDEAA